MADEQEQIIDIRSRIAPVLPLLVGLAALLVVAGGVTLVRSLTKKEEPKIPQITEKATENPGFTYIEPTATPEALGLKLPETTTKENQASPSVLPVGGMTKGLPKTGVPTFVFGLISASAVGVGFFFRKFSSKI